ncbi:carbohydrate ABC transporter permease [Spirilliplanes yamanashiensis]|uniref:Sugar ABC transporter permease n=1 Tax=Spirilliplanes yamanashiensis TaxID=42233 RepID=A0A8J3YBH0_9ACTN|nr:carbohydrate ABC transporter permease [Spirilliplanes yamanashiensis]MDP9818015.1 alpha-glucoside transport system permease protein [Spirilliplanes yamanashiensis]GIJ04824.1 sugar ABC transporter permease [Spirilliplanes yamanashiensis]
MTTTSNTPPPVAAPAHTQTKATKLTGGHGDKIHRPSWFARIVVGILCFVWIVPTVGLLVTSFRGPEDALTSGWWTALASPFDLTQWTIANYSEVWTEGGMGRAFLNSFVVSVPATIIPIMIAAFAAYAFTFMEFRGRDVLFVVIVGLLVVPNQVALVPLLRIYSDLGLNGTFLSVWLAHAGFGMPLAIYILRNYMATLPRGIIESAKVDGANHFATFWRLIVPMSVPALASFAIFQFLWVWNDLLIALVFLGTGDNAVVTVNVASLVGSQGQGWQLLTAGAFLSMVVPLLVFVSLQRYFVRGLTAGSVKG